MGRPAAAGTEQRVPVGAGVALVAHGCWTVMRNYWSVSSVSAHHVPFFGDAMVKKINVFQLFTLKRG